MEFACEVLEVVEIMSKMSRIPFLGASLERLC